MLKTFDKTEYSINDINNLISKDVIAVNKLIESNIGNDIPIIDDLSNHILSAGGKKIRPIITILTSKLCNYKGKNHIALSACVELIHTATLLHDDVIDESKLRRGIPTANDIFGNKSSILVGDFLFSRSFELMVKYGSKSILKILSKTSSIIAEGEVMQLAAIKDYYTNNETYMKIIKAKTASLFSAASEISALLAKKNNKIQNALKNYGENLGIAFQLVDDALDYIGKQNLGKKIGDDFKEGKITLPIIISITKGNKEESIFWKKTLESNNHNKNDFQKALKIIEKYNGIEITLKRAKQYSNKAINNLNIFPDSNYKNALISLAKISINRSN